MLTKRLTVILNRKGRNTRRNTGPLDRLYSDRLKGLATFSKGRPKPPLQGLTADG